MDINKVNKQHGFTIIEVALVLAIAGLIFLVVFLALPALQNSQKDMARRQDVGRVVSALQSYMADNGGNLSSLNNGSAYNISSSNLGPYVSKLGSGYGVWVVPFYNHPGPQSIDIYLNYTCAPTGSTTITPSDGSTAVVVKLSSGNYYCASV